MGVGDHGDVDVGVPAALLLGDDDLGGEGVLGVGDGVVHQADTPHHLARLLHLVAAEGKS